MALGPTAVRPHVPRLILLWRNAFPRSNRELEAEKQRGDAFTWQVRQLSDPIFSEHPETVQRR